MDRFSVLISGIKYVRRFKNEFTKNWINTNNAMLYHNRMASSLSISDRFSGKVALVTGSSSGIGEAIATLYASQGAKVTLCGRDETRLQGALSKCVEASGGHADRFLTAPGDLNDQVYRKELAQRTVDKFGKLDILVCNAGGVGATGDIENTTEEEFDFTFGLNVKSVFFTIQASLTHLDKSKGNIVTISSVLGKNPCTPTVVYPMTKAAVDHMTDCLALHLAPKGIRLNTVNPGFTKTRFIRGRSSEVDEANNAYGDLVKSGIPLGQRLGTVDDVAEAVAYLSSDAASFVTGQHLMVDGARSLSEAYHF